MADMVGNSNRISRKYLDSLLIETRYMNSAVPNLEMELYGKKFSSPIMTAALSHLDKFMFEGATAKYIEGTAMSGALMWLGMSDEKEVEDSAAGASALIEIIKTYTDRSIIFDKIRHAENLGLLAVGVDIDHPFAPDGTHDIVDGFEMTPLTTQELADICASTKLPVIAKGVLSTYDAREVVRAGVRGIVVSHHNNRIEYAIPPLKILPEIRKVVPADIPVFVDCEIQTGMDAFKAMALGANAVCIGRPLMTAIKKNGAQGVADYLKKANDELRKVMAFTGCKNLSEIEPGIIHLPTAGFSVV